MDLCLAKIVSDAGLTKAASHAVPRSLLLALARTAVQAHRPASLAELLESWPMPRLGVSQLMADSGHPVNELLYQETELQDRRKTVTSGQEMVVTLLARLLKLAQGGKVPVETLDLTGLPLETDHLVNMLQRFSDLGGTDRPLVTLVVDLYLTDQQCWRLNKLGQLRYGGVRVRVRNIYFTILSYGSTFSWQTEYLALLTKLRVVWSHIFDLSTTSGVELARLDIRSFFAEGACLEVRNRGIDFFTFLADSFSKITSLDLSYNAINLNGSPSTTQVLANFLTSQPHLSRLDLSGNRLTNSLPSLLPPAPCTLTYLNLTGCQLRGGDISYLSRLPSLHHLDLSSCSLGNKLNALLTVFSALSQLEVLEMVDCGLDQLQLQELLPGLRALSKLRLLNLLGNNVWTWVDLDCRVLVDQYQEGQWDQFDEDRLE